MDEFNMVIKLNFKRAFKYITIFIKWVLLAGITGIIGGVIGVLFNKGINYVTGIRQDNEWVIWLMPLLGLLIVFLYRKAKLQGDGGTNLILDSIRTKEQIPIKLAPLIFISTIITHFVGGSAGREGAALQLGGSIGAQVGRIFHLDEKDMHTIVMCGMAALFSALFGTPLTAAFFAMEVISVGLFYYSAFVPCVVSALSAYSMAWIFNATLTPFDLGFVPYLSFQMMFKVGILGILCALVSILFCLGLKYFKIGAEKLFANPYIRIVVGSFIMIGLILLIGQRYAGLGTKVLYESVSIGDVNSYDFFMKIIFTALTMAIGFKGGEIVPSFYIGATFGAFAGALLGINPGFAAAIGVVAVFCGVVNCPIASIVLSVELFGAGGILYFAVAVCISYMMSGYYSIYSSQKIVYSKLRAEYINKDTI